MSVDALAFLRAAERATNTWDAAACASIYAPDARVEAFTDGTHSVHVGITAITRAWQICAWTMRSLGLRVEKRLVAESGDGLVNEWDGSLANGRSVRGIERWRFDPRGRVVEHAAWTSIALMPLERPTTALRLLATQPVIVARFLRAAILAPGRRSPSAMKKSEGFTPSGV